MEFVCPGKLTALKRQSKVAPCETSQVKGKTLLPEHQILPLIILLLTAFAANLPLGYLRERARKYSLQWMFFIHASIPLLIIVRQFYGFTWHWIPVTLACAASGQLLGGWVRRRLQP